MKYDLTKSYGASDDEDHFRSEPKSHKKCSGMMEPVFIPNHLCLSANNDMKFLHEHVKHWMHRVANGRSMFFSRTPPTRSGPPRPSSLQMCHINDHST